MLELGSSGSARGVSSNGHPYRDARPIAVTVWSQSPGLCGNESGPSEAPPVIRLFYDRHQSG